MIPYFNRFLKKVAGYEERFDIKPKTNDVDSNYIFAIRREGNGIKEMTKEEIVKFLLNQSMYHGGFVDPRYILFAYSSYFDFDIEDIFKKRIDILNRLCSKTKNFMVMSKNKEELANMMRKVIE